jgi:hypothetical protein
LSWSARFIPPVPLPAGGDLGTLGEARSFLLNLPADVAALPAWQTAAGAVLLVGNHGGPTDFARIGIMQALYPTGVPVYDAERKDAHWGRRQLVRDR